MAGRAVGNTKGCATAIRSACARSRAHRKKGGSALAHRNSTSRPQRPQPGCNGVCIASVPPACAVADHRRKHRSLLRPALRAAVHLHTALPGFSLVGYRRVHRLASVMPKNGALSRRTYPNRSCAARSGPTLLAAWSLPLQGQGERIEFGARATAQARGLFRGGGRREPGGEEAA